MNKTIPFGYHSLGGHTIIKLNMNLTAADADEIREIFGFAVMRPGRYREDKMLCRIEGILSHNGSVGHNWFQKLEIYKVNAKLEKLAKRKATLLDIAIGAENLLINLNDLPF
jgi:hypothetical protein